MSVHFLESVARYIHEHYKDNVENLCIVLPNKRGALFLKQHLAKVFAKTIWLPAIISAEEFINELSGLNSPEEIDLICALYESYKFCYGENAEPFDSFAKWGHLILQDFNEIDRYLADSKQLYENLKDIKVIENWSLGEENLTPFQVRYLEFMNSLGAIYSHFSKELLLKKQGYQGLSYKMAVANLQKSDFPNKFHKILFCGFNALNAAELKIFGAFQQQKKADILWDADKYYLENPLHEAGLFLRKNLDLFQQKEISFLNDHFSGNKSIEIIHVPKQIGQAQIVRQTVESYISRNIPLDKVAIVLANEKLLWPVLQQLPEGVEHVNITMEYPLRYTSSYAFIDSILQIHLNYEKQTRKQKTIYHRDFVSLVQQPLFSTLLKGVKSSLSSNKIIGEINNKNISFISQKHIDDFLGEDKIHFSDLLHEQKEISKLCAAVTKTLERIQDYFLSERENNRALLELEYLGVLIRQMNRLGDLISKYPYFSDIRSFKQLFSQIVGNSTASFIGEPIKGLQIMGVLETRTLDFEHLIFVNVNEGVLPSGKSVNSFIPNDLKRAFGLPLYLEKDAIYSYHFYRLLQRAREITITCDSETDTFGKGEKSRFVTQLQLEMKVYNPGMIIEEKVAGAKELTAESENNIVLQKTENSLERIIKKAGDEGKYGGLSPSGLITLKECGLKFYFRYGAGLKELKEVEENAEANTFGSILHLALEHLYAELCGKVLHGSDLQTKIPLISKAVEKCFVSFFETKELSGKNVLQQEVIKVYVEKLIRNDLLLIENLKKENQFLTLNHLEQEFTAPLEINIDGKSHTVFIKGKIDRIDSIAGKIRIIDYKSSIKSSDKFDFSGFDNLFTDRNYNKQFQLMMYAWLLYKNKFCRADQMQPGIVPFREFLKDPRIITQNKQPFLFNDDFLSQFEIHLKDFVSHIFNKHSVFNQTKDAETCEYCAYRVICNR
jgi:ATP-dependent helicase/nuclease subunit B